MKKMMGIPASLAAALVAVLPSGVAFGADPQSSAAKWGAVTLPSGRSLAVEIADTPVLLARGYMYRERVPEGQGMVFLLGVLDIHPFWMKNCLTALDILWLDEQWRIVHVAAEAPPCKSDPCPTYVPMQKALYVLEVGPGQATALGLKIGDKITFAPPAPPVR